MRLFVTTFLLLAGLFNSLCLAGEPEVIKFIPNGGGPKWSPDGKYVSYYLEGYLWLYDVAADSSWQAAKYQGQKYEWLNDSQVVFMSVASFGKGRNSHRDAKLTYATINSVEKSTEFDSIREFSSREIGNPRFYNDKAGTVVLLISGSTHPLSVDWEYQRSRSTKAFRAMSHYPMTYRGRKPIYSDTDIWLVDINGKKIKRVTEGKSYLFPVLSPNATLVCASDPGKGELVILDTNGIEIANLGPAGGKYFWSRLGDAVIFATSIEDGHDILGGDVFSYSLKTDTLTQLTFTPNIAEMKPRLSPNGTMLAYRTYHRDPEDGIEILLLWYN